MVGDKKDYNVCVHLYRMRRKPGKYIREETYMISLPIFSPSLSFLLPFLSYVCFSVLSMHVERDLVNIMKLFSFKRANSETRSKNNFQEKFIIIDPREISYFRRYAEHRYSNSTVVKRENNFQKTRQFYVEKRVITNFVYLFIIRTDS